MKEGKPVKKVELYTDGACSGNPGPGGWGAILRYGEHEKELSGGAHDTTNNRMELTAVIEGLKALKEPCMVTVYSDSKYFCDGVQKGWAYGWKKRGWKKSDGKPALNPDLWEELLSWAAIRWRSSGSRDTPVTRKMNGATVWQWPRVKSTADLSPAQTYKNPPAPTQGQQGDFFCYDTAQRLSSTAMAEARRALL